MITLTIDNQIVSVAEGSSILHAARQLGIDIPTLCFAEGYCAENSCMICMVKVQGKQGYIPSCATIVTEGMVIESETTAVYDARRAALELLLAEHKGDCLAPCQLACPLHLDIPRLLRSIAAGESRKAEKILLMHTAFPLLSARLCSTNSEKACRRGQLDTALAICRLHRYLAEKMSDASMPNILPDSGKNVAIIGAGLAGISAAWHLCRFGHRCTVYDRNDKIGGKVVKDTSMRQVLNLELLRIFKAGVSFNLLHEVDNVELEQLTVNHDALLITTGIDSLGQFAAAGEEMSLIRKRHQSALNPQLFFAGASVTGSHKALNAMADAAEAAIFINDYLCQSNSFSSRFSVHMGKMSSEELAVFANNATLSPSIVSDGDQVIFDETAAKCEAKRCLNCDCRALQNCKLRAYAIQLHADQFHYKGERRLFQLDESHGEIVFESGKCISCGLCVQAAQQAGEAFGLTFIGRGFSINTAAPFHENIAASLPIAGVEAVRVCPTGALALKKWDDENE